MITTFGKLLRKLRIDRGEILKDMADKLRITSSYLSAIECGKRNIPTDLIEKIVLIYQLNDEEKKDLLDAQDESINSVKINFSQNNSMFKKDLAIQFARKFDNIDDEIAVKMLKILKGKKE